MPCTYVETFKQAGLTRSCSAENAQRSVSPQAPTIGLALGTQACMTAFVCDSGLLNYVIEFKHAMSASSFSQDQSRWLYGMLMQFALAP